MTSRRRSSSCEPVLIAVDLSGRTHPLQSLEKNHYNRSCQIHLDNAQPEVMVAADMTKYDNPVDALTTSPITIRHQLRDEVKENSLSLPSFSSSSSSSSSSAPQSSSHLLSCNLPMQQLSIGKKNSIYTSSPSLLIPERTT